MSESINQVVNYCRYEKLKIGTGLIAKFKCFAVQHTVYIAFVHASTLFAT